MLEGSLTTDPDQRRLLISEFVVIERDGSQGPSAAFKKVYLVNLDGADPSGFLVKREVADLLDLADPDDVSGLGTGVFTFPFATIESVIPLGPRRIGVINDNNYPFGSGRVTGEPDDTEFIVIRLAQRLPGRRTLKASPRYRP